jgi:putative hydrolase of the HAD superfamily
VSEPSLRPRLDVDAVSFDAGNTLIFCDPSPAALYAAALSDLGRPVDVADVAQAFSDCWEAEQRRGAPGVDRYAAEGGDARAWWRAFVERVLDRLGHDADPEGVFDRLWEDFSRPDVWHTVPESRATLERLAARGLHLAVTSNWDHRLPEILDVLELTRWFEVVTVSHLVGVEKPAAGIFTSTADRLGVPPARCAHIGDSPREDYAGAAAAGMRPILFDPERRFTGDGYLRVDRLSQLETLLG